MFYLNVKSVGPGSALLDVDGVFDFYFAGAHDWHDYDALLPIGDDRGGCQ